MKSLFALLVVLSLAAPAAHAAKKKKAAPPVEVDRNFSVPVPSTELYLSTKPNEDLGPAIASFELAVSSWSPKEFTRPTYGRVTTKFSSAGLPMISLNRLAPLFLKGDGVEGQGLHSRLGLSFARLERSGQFTLGSTFVTSQTMNLLFVRLGAQYLGPRFFKSVAQPFAEFSLLPSLALSSQSQLEGSVSRLGLPLEAGLGLMAYPSFLKDFLGMRNGAIGIGAQYIFGTVDNSKLNDLCAQGFLRLDI